MTPDLIEIVPPDFDVDIALAYATPANLTGKPIYRNAECWLNREAADKLKTTIALAKPLPAEFGKPAYPEEKAGFSWAAPN